MFKRIAIFPSYGGFGIPDEFKVIIDNDPRNWRVVVAELIDKLEDTHSHMSQEIYDEFVHKPFDKNNWYIKYEDYFYFKTEENSSFALKIKVVEVNTSKKWKISEYDGAEEIVYFEEPELVDKELNMYRW